MLKPDVRHAASAPLRCGRRRLLAGLAVGASLAAPGVAWGQCSPAAPATTVTCSGTSGAYSNPADGVSVTVQASASVAAPLVISGNNGTLTTAGGSNPGSISGTNTATYATVQFGNNANITNNGSITSTSTANGAAAISVGSGSTVTNNGTLQAAAGTPVVEFGPGGTFINTASAVAPVVGNIVFGINIGGNVANFSNSAIFTGTSTVTGFNGNVTVTGNANIYNNGIWNGSFIQSTSGYGTTVTFKNDTTGAFTGAIFTQDQTTLINNATGQNAATTTAYGLYIIGSAAQQSSIGLPGTVSSFTNNGAATIGTVASPTRFTVYGNFTQTANGTLNLAIASAGTGTVTAGSTYSQLYAAGPSGTANLAGTINLNVGPGFYGTGTLYQLILADQAINLTTGSLALTGSTLPFVIFCPVGNVTGSGSNLSCNSSSTINSVTAVGTKSAIELEAIHATNYATALATTLANAKVSPATSNELAIAGSASTASNPTGLNVLIPLATQTTSGAEALFLGYVDVQNYSDARTFLDSISPEGYYAYALALRDQANTFARQVDLRLEDQNSNHDEDGWWGSVDGQFHFGKNTGYNTKSNLYGINLGYDYSGPRHVYGAAVSASWDSLHYAPGTLAGHNRDLALAAYAGVSRGPFHLTGQVQYNFGHLGATKTIIFNQSTGSPTDITANASAAEHLFKATGSLGFQVRTGMVLFEPFVGIDFMRGRINSFTESSSFTAAQLTVNAISANRTDALFGAQVSRSRGVFRPYARVVYRQRVAGPETGLVTAYFDGQSAATFAVYGKPEGRHEIDTNAGINWVFDDAGSLFVGYQNTLRTGMHSHGVNLGIRIEF